MSEQMYFAYGSNINLTQMAFRCPDAEVVGPVLLTDYKLAFRSGSGVATIIPTQGQQVHGLLWKLTQACEKSLDQYEGYPRFYYKDSVTVTDSLGNRHTVMAYIMAREFEREPSLPSSSYYMGIAEGYRQNGMPLQPLKRALEDCRKEVAAFEQAEKNRQFRFDWHDFKPYKPKER